MPKTEPASEPVLSVTQTAAVLDVDVSTVHRMIRRGVLPATKFPGRTGAYVISRADVDALLTEPERSAS